MSKISFVEQISDDIRETMEQGLKDYETSHSIGLKYTSPKNLQHFVVSPSIDEAFRHLPFQRF